MIKTYKKNASTQLSANFKLYEFSCNGTGCCNETLIDTELVEILQKIRDRFNKPVHIFSAHRCKTHNRTLGSGDKSLHVLGKAADIEVKGITPKEIAQYAESIGVKGIGLYETEADGHFVHIYTRDKKFFWYGKAEAQRSTFIEKEPDLKVAEWQKAAVLDGFKFPKCGCDGKWGAECEAIAKQAVCKKRLVYKYKNLTKIIQTAVGVKADGKFGKDTKKAVTEWQKRCGLVADGCVGFNTWKRLLGV